MEPFQQKWYYAPDMHGSYSIKMVLPALVPDLSYEGMAIADGQAASYAFESLMYMDDEEKKKKIKEELLQYCNLDTEAMVRVWESFKNRKLEVNTFNAETGRRREGVSPAERAKLM